MTAIFGEVRFDGADIHDDMDRMQRALRRFGPDRSGAWVSDAGDAALGACTAFLLPEDDADDQPAMAPGGGRYLVAGDIRLSERDDLASTLGLDARVRRLSDRVLVAAALERWDDDAFLHIYGDYAVAAYDRFARRLILARDHVGRKPLFFHQSDRFFAFASMPAGLHALPDVPKAADRDEIARQLRYLPASPGKSTFAGIGRVNPGHVAIVEKGRIRQRRYWEPDLSPLTLSNPADYTDALRERIEAAVAASLRGTDGRVATHLSAGFDSTAVTALAARQLAARGGRVVAYTAAPRKGYRLPAGRETVYDESILAAETARLHANVEHVVLRPGDGPIGRLDGLVSELGMLPHDIVSQTWVDAINGDARDRGIRILLEAGLGNQSISDTGERALHDLARSGRMRDWLALALSLRRTGWTGWRGILWSTVEIWLPDGLYRTARRLAGRTDVPIEALSPLSRDVWDSVTDEERRASADRHPMDRGWFAALEREMPDTATSRLALFPYDFGPYRKHPLAEFGIDCRDPTSDRRLVEFSLRIPVEEMIRDGRPRYMLREILAGIAPPSVLDNRRSGRQIADWRLMLDENWSAIRAEIDRIEVDSVYGELVDTRRLKKLVEDWPARRDGGEDASALEADYRYALMRGIATVAFIRRTNGYNA